MSMIECSECKKEISNKSDKCLNCGAPIKKKSRLPLVLVGIFGVGFINSLLGNHSSTEQPNFSPIPSTTSESAASEATVPLKPEWNITSDVDSVSGKELKLAAIDSTNQVDMAFPYDGGSVGSIIIRKHPRFGKEILFKVSKGQLLCGISNGCTLQVRFDDKPARQVHATRPSDYSSDTLFLSGYGGLIKEIGASEKMIVEAEFFQNGLKTYEFSVQGLLWD